MDFVETDLVGDWVPEEAAYSNDYSAATGRQKHYTILKQEDITDLIENDISEVCGVLSVPRGVACSLLCQHSWSLTSAYEEWFAAAEGERNPDPSVKPPQGSIQNLCNICYKTTRSGKLASASCGHLFCTQCWKSYIGKAVKDGNACLRLRCPELGCSAAVTFDMVKKLAPEGDVIRYDEYLRRSYVESSRNRKWCPGAGCNRAVELDLEVESERYDVVCDCSYKFCWKCGEEWHGPVDCKAAAEWVKKNRTEAASAIWILDNTKPCPKCSCPIQENVRSFDLTFTKCKAPCRFEFCWKCLAPWKGIANDSCWTGCSLKKVEESMRKKGKRFLDRYIHCYERWDANDKLRKRAMEDLKRVKIEGLRQLLVEAWEQIVEFSRVLKWSYVYGYYLPSEEGRKTEFLEFLQGQAEVKLEMLHCCVENENMNIGSDDIEGFSLDSEFRAKLLCLISVTGKYFADLVRALENDLAEAENYVVMAEDENDLAEAENYVVMAEDENDLAHEVEPDLEKKKEIKDKESSAPDLEQEKEIKDKESSPPDLEKQKEIKDKERDGERGAP